MRTLQQLGYFCFSKTALEAEEELAARPEAGLATLGTSLGMAAEVLNLALKAAPLEDFLPDASLALFSSQRMRKRRSADVSGRFDGGDSP